MTPPHYHATTVATNVPRNVIYLHFDLGAPMLHPWSCHYSQYLVLEILLLCKIEISVKSRWSFTLTGVGWGSTGGSVVGACGNCVGMVLAGERIGMVVATCARAQVCVCVKVGLRGGQDDAPFAVKPPHIRYVWKWLILQGF